VGDSVNELPKCPQCDSAFTYEDRAIYVCPECANEWPCAPESDELDAGVSIVDSNANVLSDGDTVAVIKDLKVKGSAFVIKVGTRVKNVRLVAGDHNIDCKISGVDSMQLKSEFVKKV